MLGGKEKAKNGIAERECERANLCQPLGFLHRPMGDCLRSWFQSLRFFPRNFSEYCKSYRTNYASIFFWQLSGGREIHSLHPADAHALSFTLFCTNLIIGKLSFLFILISSYIYLHLITYHSILNFYLNSSFRRREEKYKIIFVLFWSHPAVLRVYFWPCAQGFLVEPGGPYGVPEITTIKNAILICCTITLAPQVHY